MKIIVLNLPRTLNQKQLQELFQAYGKVAACDLVIDKVTGRSKGFGFVEMPENAQGSAAIAALHGKMVDNCKLRVKISDQNAG